jgi:hypothetical protein
MNHLQSWMARAGALGAVMLLCSSSLAADPIVPPDHTDDVATHRWSLTPIAEGGWLAFNYGRTVVPTTNGQLAYSLPTTIAGGGMALGIPLRDALALRLTGMYSAGLDGKGMGLSLLGADLVLEDSFSFASRGALFIGLGSAVTGVFLTAQSGDGGSDTSLHAVLYGGVARAGVDWRLSDAASIRLGFFGRGHLNDAQYTSSSASLDDAWSRRRDRYASLGGTLGFSLLF